MNIIEKLCIETPNELKIVGDVWKVYELAGLPRPHVSNDLFFEQGSTIKRLLDVRNEMLEALIEDAIDYETGVNEGFISIFYFERRKKIIEKATGKSWEEIKEIL